MQGTSSSALKRYRDKRTAGVTPEPFSQGQVPTTGKLFVVQQHAASHLHFDLRLEVDGVLKSWAVPKGPSDDPSDKRFAVETEDHPLDYANFEGAIPAGNYGAGHVIVWDRGRFEWVSDFHSGYEKGKLLFDFYGHKLKGRWTLVRLKGKNYNANQWLLIKEHDQYVADSGPSFVHTSVLSGMSVSQLAKPKSRIATLRRQIAKLNAPKVSSHGIPKPMLATSGQASNAKGWLWELKYDGYRVLAQRDAQEVNLYSRNGLDLAAKFPEVCQVLRHLPIQQFVIDGELTVHDASGRPNFALMQGRARWQDSIQIGSQAIVQPATYYCFDLLEFETTNLRDVELYKRKQALQRLIPKHSALVYSQHIEGAGQNTYQTAQSLGLEGVVGKRAKAKYMPGRSNDWIKVRHQTSQEFVVVGWSPSQSSVTRRKAALSDPYNTESQDIGSLAVAEYHSNELVYVGNVGTGLRQDMRTTLLKQFRSMHRKTSPLANPPKRAPGKQIHWLTPKLVVELTYLEYTQHGHLRHPSFVRVRDDKAPQECTGHNDIPSADTSELYSQSTRPQVTVTNPDKIFFPEPGYNKADVVNYYRSIAPWMLPYLKDRPIVLTRYPNGISGKSFFQRDAPDYVPAWIRVSSMYSESSKRDIHFFVAEQPEDLAYLANLGTLPIHMWHSRLSDLQHPDWCVIDLDPKAAPFSQVVILAKALKDIADEMQLPAYLKTSGASGLHILLPLQGQLNHEQARSLGELLATLLVQQHPDIATIARSVRARQNKVYVDYLQNGHGRLLVAPFAIRAEPGASVSMPLKWRELNKATRNEKFHIGNAIRRMRRMGEDPNSGLLTVQSDLLKSLEILSGLLDNKN